MPVQLAIWMKYQKFVKNLNSLHQIPILMLAFFHPLFAKDVAMDQKHCKLFREFSGKEFLKC